jgi:uncharacterized protein with von Willebrand factor type A (vWA) domain
MEQSSNVCYCRTSYERKKRDVHIYLFDTFIKDEIILSKNRKNNQELLDLAGRRVSGGGTAFNCVLSHAIYNTKIRRTCRHINDH